MRVCVVGGTGNISTSFVRLLLELGHEVTCFNRGKSPGLPSGAKVIVGDRANEPAYEAAMQAQKFDAAIDMICFNAAQAASSIRAFRGEKHFVHCSTVCTYGVAYDWPIGYDDLEPYYTKVDWEMGVSGVPGPFDARRSRPYPMPPLPVKSSGEIGRAHV